MNERAAGGVKVCRSIWESVALLSESPAENPSAGDPDDERTAKAVSYTHLDVYKRQGMLRTNMILSFAFMESLSIYGLLVSFLLFAQI